MSKAPPYFKFYPSQYMIDVMGMNADEMSRYLSSICRAWVNCDLEKMPEWMRDQFISLATKNKKISESVTKYHAEKVSSTEVQPSSTEVQPSSTEVQPSSTEVAHLFSSLLVSSSCSSEDGSMVGSRGGERESAEREGGGAENAERAETALQATKTPEAGPTIPQGPFVDSTPVSGPANGIARLPLDIAILDVGPPKWKTQGEAIYNGIRRAREAGHEIDHDKIVRGAKIYAHMKKGEEQKYISDVDNWLSRGDWLKYQTAPKKRRLPVC